MALQLVLRKYLNKAKDQYKLLGVPLEIKKEYRIPSDPRDLANKFFYRPMLYRAPLAVLRSALRTHGYIQHEGSFRPNWKKEYVFVLIELYPGLVCGICLLTPEGPRRLWFKVRRGIEPRIVLYNEFLTERSRHYNSFDEGWDRGLDHALLRSPIFTTCSPF